MNSFKMQLERQKQDREKEREQKREQKEQLRKMQDEMATTALVTKMEEHIQASVARLEDSQSKQQSQVCRYQSTEDLRYVAR